jgi:hypothetical protein
MTSNRTISLALLVIAAILSATPADASANSLLSGYGGPGQGSQAILGSALLGGGGSSGGGGVSEGAGTQSSSGLGKSSTGAAAVRSGERVGDGAGSRARGGSARASGSATGAEGVSGTNASVYPPASAERTYLADAGGAGALSGGELVYGLVALAALALTALIAMRLRGDERTGGAS